MTQTVLLTETLKKALKMHGKTYADVARDIGLSEASIKRLFSEKNFSITRLEQICETMNLELTDLFRMMNENRQSLSSLTIEQEEEIAGDLSLLLVTVCVLNRWTLEEITGKYRISTTEGIRLLAKLDRLKIIELLPGNRIKLLVASNFKWIENGPIQKFFQSKVEKDFFNTRFDQDYECLFVANGMLSMKSNAAFQQKLERLVREFNELNDQEASLPISERFGNTVVLAMRQWQYGLFEHLRR